MPLVRMSQSHQAAKRQAALGQGSVGSLVAFVPGHCFVFGQKVSPT